MNFWADCMKERLCRPYRAKRVRGLIPKAALRLPWAMLYRALSPNRTGRKRTQRIKVSLRSLGSFAATVLFVLLQDAGGTGGYSEAMSFSQSLSLSNTLRRNSVSPAPLEVVASGSIGNRMVKVVPLPSSLRASIFPP